MNGLGQTASLSNKLMSMCAAPESRVSAVPNLWKTCVALQCADGIKCHNWVKQLSPQTAAACKPPLTHV